MPLLCPLLPGRGADLYSIRRNGPATSTVRVLAAVLVASLWLGAVPAAGAVPITPARLRVCIDPGHGGVYTGAGYAGITEKTLNLQIAKRVQSQLKARGIDAQLTRSGDTRVYDGGSVRTWRWDDAAGKYRYDYFPVVDSGDRLSLDLQARCDAANASGADLFVSIHNNAAGSSASGAEVWRAPNDPLGEQLGADVQSNLIGATGAVNRGVFTANFYVVRWTSVPAVLVECGFGTNANELARLKSTSYQNKVADGIADGIVKFAARPVNERFTRVWGSDRYATAAGVSKRGWPGSAGTVVLVSGEVFADSLVAGPLASSLGAPILSASGKGLSPVVAAELKRLSPDRIIVVGGPASVPQQVADQAADAAGVARTAVERVGGADRYAVSVNVARMLESAATTSVVVASGEVFPDALSVAASAAQRREPIVLTAKSGLTPEARAIVAPAGKARTVTLVGGPVTVPDAVMSGIAFTRLSGANRYDTNWAVLGARYTEAQRRRPMVASGEVFADALVLGPLAAKEDRPVLLIGKAAASQNLRPWIYERRDVTLDPVVVGGPASVSAYLDPMFEKMRMRTYE